MPRKIDPPDSGRPEPTAWWCPTLNYAHAKDPEEYNPHPICMIKGHIPLYPPPVVAGELYEMASWINKTFGDKPDGTHNDELDETVLELARRGNEWEEI